MASAAPTPEPANDAEKSLFRIGEVSRLTATKTFVLRYWETEFPMLEPVKSPSGHRLYRREDIETVFEIKRLLYEEGFTTRRRAQIFGRSRRRTERRRRRRKRREPRRGACSYAGTASRTCFTPTTQVPAGFARRAARRLDPSRTRVIRWLMLANGRDVAQPGSAHAWGA